MNASACRGFFNGKNGLLIPLDEVFESKFFVVEVRFMPTKAADIGNIIAAEPPGRGIDGWQIRLSGTELQYGLGIAYDAMHQDAYGRKFFTGKIDYIRYGKIK